MIIGARSHLDIVPPRESFLRIPEVLLFFFLAAESMID